MDMDTPEKLAELFPLDISDGDVPRFGDIFDLDNRSDTSVDKPKDRAGKAQIASSNPLGGTTMWSVKGKGNDDAFRPQNVASIPGKDNASKQEMASGSTLWEDGTPSVKEKEDDNAFTTNMTSHVKEKGNAVVSIPENIASTATEEKTNDAVKPESVTSFVKGKEAINAAADEPGTMTPPVKGKEVINTAPAVEPEATMSVVMGKEDDTATATIKPKTVTSVVKGKEAAGAKPETKTSFVIGKEGTEATDNTVEPENGASHVTNKEEDTVEPEIANGGTRTANDPEPIKEGDSIGMVRYHGASVSGTIRKIRWVEAEGEPACYLSFTVRFESGAGEDKPKMGGIVCEVHNHVESGISSAGESNDLPRFFALNQKLLVKQEPPTEVKISKLQSFNPSEHVQGVDASGPPSDCINPTDTLKTGWALQGSITDGASERSRYKLHVQANECHAGGDKGLVELVDAEVLIQHSNQPLLIDFSVSASFSTNIEGIAGILQVPSHQRRFFYSPNPTPRVLLLDPSTSSIWHARAAKAEKEVDRHSPMVSFIQWVGARVMPSEPPVKAGMKRVYWTCVCGRHMSDDLDNSSPELVENVQAWLNHIYAGVPPANITAAEVQDGVEQSAGRERPEREPESGPATDARDPVSLPLTFPPPPMATSTAVSRSEGGSEGLGSRSDAPTQTNGNAGLARNVEMHVMACFEQVKAGLFVRQIDCTSFQSDHELFETIRKIYYDSLPRLFRWLDVYEMKDITCSKFDYSGAVWIPITVVTKKNNWPPANNQTIWKYTPQSAAKARGVLVLKRLLHLWLYPHHADSYSYTMWKANASRQQRLQDWWYCQIVAVAQYFQPEHPEADRSTQWSPLIPFYLQPGWAINPSAPTREVYDAVPKKIGGRLKVPPGKHHVNGWGLVFEQGVRLFRVLWILLIAVVIWSVIVFADFGFRGQLGKPESLGTWIVLFTYIVGVLGVLFTVVIGEAKR